MQIKTAIADFLEAKQDLSPRTLEQYTGALKVLERNIRRMPGTPVMVRRVLNQASTIWVKHSWWAVYGAFYTWCRREYDLVNPMEKVDQPKLPEVEMKSLPPSDLSALLAAALCRRAKCILALALDSGVRASEFGRIRIQDIAPDTVLVHGKGNRQVRVPISPETYYILQSCITELPDHRPGALVFGNLKGAPTCRDVVYKIVRRCMDRAGISGPKRGPHCLRHSLGMNYIANGGDPFTLKKVMRHKNISTTNKYVNLSLQQVVEFHHKYSPLKAALQGAQGVLIKSQVLQEAEAIVRG